VADSYVPWLKPFAAAAYFAGLKPGASTAGKDIFITAANSPRGHSNFESGKRVPSMAKAERFHRFAARLKGAPLQQAIDAPPRFRFALPA